MDRQRRAAEPLKPRVAQKPLEEGLFGERAKQEELPVKAPEAARPGAYEAGQTKDELPEPAHAAEIRYKGKRISSRARRAWHG
jgi:hypothetical protein